MNGNSRGISDTFYGRIRVRLTLYAPPIQLGFYLLTSSKIHWFPLIKIDVSNVLEFTWCVCRERVCVCVAAFTLSHCDGLCIALHCALWCCCSCYCCWIVVIVACSLLRALNILSHSDSTLQPAVCACVFYVYWICICLYTYEYTYVPRRAMSIRQMNGIQLTPFVCSFVLPPQTSHTCDTMLCHL